MQQEKAAWELYANMPEPLHWVASIGDHVVIRQLVSGSDGAKMISRSEQDASGRTPLMKSSFWGKTTATQQLIAEYHQKPRPEPLQINQEWMPLVGWLDTRCSVTA